MNHILPYFRSRPIRWAGFALLLLTAATLLRAQSAPPPAPAAVEPSVAAMSQDVQELQRTVNQLSLQVETLQQDNARLKAQIPSTQDLKNMIDNAIAESRAETSKDITQADADLRKEILANVAQQIKAMGDDTNVQLKKLANAIADKPAAPAVAVHRDPLPPNTKVEVYTVKRGDSIGKIALLYKVSSSDILSANPQLSDPSKVREGQQLAIPLKDGVTAVPASTGN
jgi:LysM repeat protein